MKLRWYAYRLRFWLWLYDYAGARAGITPNVAIPPPLLRGPRTLRLPRSRARRFE
jgi:hypothetical protein